MCRTGAIECRKMGRNWVTTKDSIEDLLKNHSRRRYYNENIFRKLGLGLGLAGLIAGFYFAFNPDAPSLLSAQKFQISDGKPAIAQFSLHQNSGLYWFESRYAESMDTNYNTMVASIDFKTTSQKGMVAGEETLRPNDVVVLESSNFEDPLRSNGGVVAIFELASTAIIQPKAVSEPIIGLPSAISTALTAIDTSQFVLKTDLIPTGTGPTTTTTTTTTIGGTTTTTTTSGTAASSTASLDKNSIVTIKSLTISGLGTGILHANASGLLSSSTLNLPSSDITGILGVGNGGTGTSVALTDGSLVFAGTNGIYTQDSANLFWDDTNNRLGILTKTPATTLHVGSGTARFDKDVIVGGATASIENITNPGFVMNGDDLFVAGQGGFAGNVYTNGSFIAGGGTATISSTGVSFSSTNPSISVGNGGTFEFKDSQGNNLLSIIDDGTTAKLSGIDEIDCTDCISGDEIANSGTYDFTGAVSITPGSGSDFTINMDADSTVITNAVITSDASVNLHNIAITDTASAEAGLLNGLAVRNLDDGGVTTGSPDSLVFLTSLDTDETVNNAIFIEQNAEGGTLNSGINVTNTAGTLNYAINLAGTFTKLLESPTVDISNAGVITGATGITSSGTITFSGLTSCDTIDTNSSGVLACGSDSGAASGAPTDATYVTLSTNSTLTAERTLAGGSGLTLTDAGANGAATLAVGAGTGITVNADDIAIDSTVATLTGSQTLTNKTLTAPKFADLGFIADANGNELIILDTVGSAVNEITLANAATGVNPAITLSGGDTNIGLTLTGKGTGTFTFASSTANTDTLILKPQVGTATATFGGTITSAELTADRTWTFPNAGGTVAVSASSPIALSSGGDISCATCLTSSGGGTFALTLAGTSGSNQTISAGDTVTIEAGTGVTTTGAATDKVTVAIGQAVATTDTPTFAALTLSRAGNLLTATNTTDNASVQTAILQGDRATMADNDEAYVTLRLSDDAGTQTEVGRFTWVGTDVNAATSVDGRLDFAVMTAGTLAKELQLLGADLSPSTSDGLALGTGSLMWADLFLASAGVINFNNGDVTLTHGTDTLTVGGGNLLVSSPGTAANSVATIDGTQTLTNKTLTAPKFADLGFVADANGNELIILDTVASAVNEITLANAATTTNPTITASGGDTNIGIDITLKGTGTFRLLGNATQPAELRLFEDTDLGTNFTAFKNPSLAGDITYTLPPDDGDAGEQLQTDGSGVLTWEAAGSGSGDITAVGSMLSGAAFADSTADDDWLGLGSAAGRIEFDDQTNDEVNIVTAILGVGTQTPSGRVHLAGDLTASAWGLNAIHLQSAAATFTDSSTAASGTATNAVFNSFGTPTLAASNTSVTTTNASTVYIAAAPTAGTNQTITNGYALWVDAGDVRFDGVVLNSGGSESAPSYSFQGDSNNGIFSSGADAINIATAGTERLRVDSSGNVIIGDNEGGTPAGNTLRGPYAVGTNIAGGATVFAASRGTGTGSEGTIAWDLALQKEASGGTVHSVTNGVMQLGHAWSNHSGLNGSIWRLKSAEVYDEDTAASGTATNHAVHGVGVPTITGRNTSVTTTNAATFYIAGAPSAGANMTLTNTYSLWVDAGDVRFDGVIKAGSTPTTLTDSAGKILSAALNTVAVGQGGTGQTSYTDGQLLIGNTTGNTLTKATLTGTSNQITVTNGNGSITLSTPQDIATASTPQFARLGLGAAAASAVVLDVELADASSITAEQAMLRIQNSAQTLTDGTTITNWRAAQFLAPTLNGVAGGGTETVTSAATVYIDGAPSGSNISITSPYALWVDAGTSRFEGIINVNLDASQYVTINAAANTGTSGVVTLDIDTVTNNHKGIYLDYQVKDAAANVTTYGERIDLTVDTDADQSHTVAGSYIGITANDASSTTYGLQVVAEDAGGQVATAGILIENLQATDIDLTTGLLIRATTADSIATAVDVSDDEITTGISLGANTLLGTTGIINYNNFDVDASGNLDTAGTITAGSSNTVLTLATGLIDADALTLTTATDGGTGTSSGSGFIARSDGIGLLQGCTDAQILKWVESTDTWDCAADADSGGATAWNNIGDPTAANSITFGDGETSTFVYSHTSGDQNAWIFDFNQVDDAAATDDFDAMRFDLTSESGDAGDTFDGIVINWENGTANTVFDSAIKIDNAETTASTLTDAIVITSSGVDGGVVDAIDVSATNLTNAINVGPNTILGTSTVINFDNFDVNSSGDLTIASAARSSGTPNLVTVTGPAHTGLTASTEASDIIFDLDRGGSDVQFATGALTTQRAVQITAPKYGFVGASTITNAATFYISAAPSAGTNATITNAWALWIDAGLARFDGAIVKTVEDMTIADDTVALQSPTGTLTPTTSYVEVTCNDGDGCNFTISETGAKQGQILTIINEGTNTVTLNDTAGVIESTADTLGQYQSASFIYMSDRWVQTARSLN